MFVLCVLHSKDKTQNAGQSRRRNKQDKAQRQNKRIKKISVGPYFSHLSTPVSGTTQPPLQRKPGLLAGGVKRPGRGVDHLPHLALRSKKV
jgi:hypothetical protein